VLNVLFELHSLYITAGHSAPQALENPRSLTSMQAPQAHSRMKHNATHLYGGKAVVLSHHSGHVNDEVGGQPVLHL
jgi:starvation-inducible outer membrane lipoprotein